MKANALFVPIVLAVVAGAFLATFFLSSSQRHGYVRRSSAGLIKRWPGADGQIGRRSLGLKLQFNYDPKTVTFKVPNTEIPQSFFDSSEPLNPYPLRNLDEIPDVKADKKGHLLLWLEEHFSDLSRCMNYECTSDVDLCDNTLQTSYDGDAPPCCTHILRDMLHTFDTAMLYLGLEYFIGFGSLLGFIRSGRVIPWSIDNDITLENPKTLRVLAELWNTQATGMHVIFPNIRRGEMRGVPRMCVTKDFAGGRLQKWKKQPLIDPETNKPVLFHDRGFPYLDFYFGMDMDHNTWGDEYRRCQHFREDVFPAKRFTVYDGQFALNFPANPAALLNRYYGEDWMVPKRDDSGHGQPFFVCKLNYGLE